MKICTQISLPENLESVSRRIAAKLNPRNMAATGAVTLSKRWLSGSRLTVAFIDGALDQHDRVQPYFHEWERYVNISFLFILNKWNADLRVSFAPEGGSWSVVGTDAMFIPHEEASINLGWITPDQDEAEVRRVVLHEVGHALGFEHELQSPGAGGPKYDERKIIDYYSGPPYNWSVDEVHRQVLTKLNPEGVRFTDFDPKSIMCYHVPDKWTLDGRGTPWNLELSQSDKELAKELYPW
jgi:hypothetical protein